MVLRYRSHHESRQLAPGTINLRLGGRAPARVRSSHVRTVPVPDWLVSELDVWLTAAAIDRGRLFRRVDKVGKSGERIRSVVNGRIGIEPNP